MEYALKKSRMLKKYNVIYTLHIMIDNWDLLPPLERDDEKYSIYMETDVDWYLHANKYAGFVRGLETFA